MSIKIIAFLILGISVGCICFAQSDPKSTDSSIGSAPSVSSDINNGNNGGSGDYGYDRNNEDNGIKVVNGTTGTGENNQTTNST
jgi:hypothetical protein